jgi:tetratricopeptide (TPR) repeat protein
MRQKRLDFRFSLPSQPRGPVVELSIEEAEKVLLLKLEAERNEPNNALWALARFYQQVKRGPRALECLRKVLERTDGPEAKAATVLAMGQTMETVGDFEGAVRFYKEAMSLEPVNTPTWYFINNNLGFSFNYLGQFAEGERFCRQAIQVDPARPNAYKNLGIALAGEGDYHGAAKCFVRATQADAADPRAARLLQELLEEHPELHFEFEGQADCCQRAVQAVANHAAQSQPIVHRGWRKHLVLLKLNTRCIWLRLRTVFTRFCG